MKLSTEMDRGKTNLMSQKITKWQPFYNDIIRNLNEKLHRKRGEKSRNIYK